MDAHVVGDFNANGAGRNNVSPWNNIIKITLQRYGLHDEIYLV